MSEATIHIKQKATALGFDLVGMAPAISHPHFKFFEQWIAKGYGATMEWLQRSIEKRGDPQRVLPGAKSILVCGMNYFRGKPLSIQAQKKGHGWISNYAWGDDYHDIFLKKLRLLEEQIRQIFPQIQTRAYVDTGPILERSYGWLAGLGWIGKNTCLIHTQKGSFFFLGEILLDVALDYDRPEMDHCGRCTRCLDACPTQALTPYEMNASRCVSYLTIEHRGSIPEELQQKMGQHLVGCDICQDVCPWNSKATPGTESAFDPRDKNFLPELETETLLTEEEFRTRFKKSPIKRLKLERWMRNREIALKNNH